MTIFWILYTIIAVLVGWGIFTSGSASNAIQDQLEKHPKQSTAFVVWMAVAVIAFCIIVWPFFVGVVIYKTIKLAIEAADRERNCDDPYKKMARAILKDMEK